MEYAKEFSESKFWQKVKTISKKVGSKVVETALVMFYCFKDPDTPMWAKGVIIGALGYLIAPIDLIPDILPGGLVDDAATLAIAMASVAEYIKSEHRALAKSKVIQWFG